MVLLGEEAQVEAHFWHLEMMLILTQDFGRTRWNSLVMWVMWNLVLVHLETVLASVQDRCTLCAKVPEVQKSF